MEGERLKGFVGESILTYLLNQKKNITAFNIGADGIDLLVADRNQKDKRLFEEGVSPFSVQVKTRTVGNDAEIKTKDLKNITNFTNKLGLSEESVYFAFGFIKGRDIRNIKYYLIPMKYFEFIKKEWGNLCFTKQKIEKLLKSDKDQIGRFKNKIIIL